MPARPCLLVACAPSGSRIHPPYVKLFRKNCPAESTRIVERPKNQGPEQLQLATAAPPFDAGGYMTVVQIQRRQDRASTQALVFVIAADSGIFAGNGRQIRSGIGEGLQSRLLIH